MSVGRGKKKDRKGERNLSACGTGMEIIAEQSKNDWMAYIAKRK